MKFSLAASVFILAAGAGLGWHDRQQLAAIRTTQKQLAAEAAQFGVSSDPAQITKRERPARPAAAKRSTTELIELAGKSLQLPLFDSLSGLDPAAIKAVFAETVTNPDLDEQTRMILTSCCTTVLANDHPQAALEIFTHSPELFTGGDRGMSLVCTALACWAKNDPMAALDWVRKNPQQASDYAKHGMFSAVAEQDARLAFRLIRELGLKSPNQAVGQIVSSAKTLEKKSAALAGLRDYLAAIPDENVRAEVTKSSISRLAGHLGQESFDSATRWISEQNLTQQERSPLVEGLNISTSNGETGRWIEWLRNSPPDQAPDSRIRHLIYDWTCADYQTALRWAVTRPPGNDRDQVLKTIHGNWPKEDPAGKEAFAREHGLNP